jgi:hypothetical protein
MNSLGGSKYGNSHTQQTRPEPRWTTATDLKEQLSRRWERGVLLRTLLTCEIGFPFRLTLKAPTSQDLAERFEAVRDWIAALTSISRIRIEWREVNHRVQGAQRLPASVWVDTLNDAIAMIGKRSDMVRFESMLAMTQAMKPTLLQWLGKRPLQAIDLAEAWPRLLDVVAWIETHPRPGIYLRQVDIPGIHSKFIEAHYGVLAELLDLVLPPGVVAADQIGARRFASRYGFLDKPLLIRFRVLDERIVLLPGPTNLDVTLDADSFAKLDAPVRCVFITENETNFLAFPAVADSIVIFGAGYGWDALAKATWLTRCSIHYWGDIDTHGFAILDSIRNRFAHTASFLMDRPTLMAHESLWGHEPNQVVHDLPRLTKDERALYDELRDNSILNQLRLEQEMIGFGHVIAALGSCVPSNSH